MFFSSGTASVSKSNPLSLPLRKGERGLSLLFVLHLDNHFENRSENFTLHIILVKAVLQPLPRLTATSISVEI